MIDMQSAALTRNKSWARLVLDMFTGQFILDLWRQSYHKVD